MLVSRLGAALESAQTQLKGEQLVAMFAGKSGLFNSGRGELVNNSCY